MSDDLDFLAILRVLIEHDVDFILVGGLAAILHGASIVTMDVDIVHRRDDENIGRLISALHEIDAHFRYHSNKITPKESHLRSSGHQLLRTRYGDLDVLGTIDEGRGFDELVADSEIVLINAQECRLLTLAALIEVKGRAGRDKDLAALPVLRSALALLSKS